MGSSKTVYLFVASAACSIAGIAVLDLYPFGYLGVPGLNGLVVLTALALATAASAIGLYRLIRRM